jgi:sugar (pentulose or hexulose) kinase
VQAALEAVAYRFAEIYEQLNDVCVIKEIIASGGALRNRPSGRKSYLTFSGKI